jgi:protein SCO1/2
MASLQRRFKLGVNFTGSVVNRHRIEAHLLDQHGRIAYSFERLRWDEKEVVDRAISLLKVSTVPDLFAPASPALGTAAAIGFAVFPKCPVCWTAYLSMLGIVGLERIHYSPWIGITLASVALLNLASVWIRARATRRIAAPLLATTGFAMIGASWFGLPLAGFGIVATLAGSVISALANRAGVRTPTGLES